MLVGPVISAQFAPVGFIMMRYFSEFPILKTLFIILKKLLRFLTLGVISGRVT